jgi:transposase
VPSVSHLASTHLGLDVHKDTISVAILAPDRDGHDVERIAHDQASGRRLVGASQFPAAASLLPGRPDRLRAGPAAAQHGVGCEVIAPSLIPKAPGDKVKTDTRDCRRLARLYRAGELVAHPDPQRPGRGGRGPVPGLC